MTDAVKAYRALQALAVILPPELQRVVRDELLDEMYFAYWRRWEADL